MIALRKSVDPSTRNATETKILQFLNQSDEIKAASGLGLYWSVGSEVPTHLIFSTFHKQMKRLYLPRYAAGQNFLEMVAVTSPKDFEKGSFGTLQPKSTFQAVSLDQISVLLVPGLAFDRFGNRLGRGMGFYDRLLADFKGLKIGLAFSAQVLDQVPTETHDQRVDWVLTEQGLIGREK